MPESPASLYEIETVAHRYGLQHIVGVDEAGRGPLAGPIVAAAVALPPAFRHDDLNDSKVMTAPEREVVFEALLAAPDIVATAAVISASEIDRLNVLRANDVAMQRATVQFDEIDLILVDGLPVPGMPAPCRSIVKGDRKCACIAAASVIAKVLRDRLMTAYGERFPGYGFEQHKGYGTVEHLTALAALGASPIHRRSFAPVAWVEAEKFQPSFDFL